MDIWGTPYAESITIGKMHYLGSRQMRRRFCAAPAVSSTVPYVAHSLCQLPMVYPRTREKIPMDLIHSCCQSCITAEMCPSELNFHLKARLLLTSYAYCPIEAGDSGILKAHQAQMKQQPRSDVYEMVYPFLRRSAFWF